MSDSSGTGGATYRYRLIEPSKDAIADPGARVPLVVFLHGSGERGNDNQAQTEAGLGPYLRGHADTFPALVVLPQVPPRTTRLGPDEGPVGLGSADDW